MANQQDGPTKVDGSTDEDLHEREVETMSERNCPKCSVSMHHWTSSGVTLDHCNTCKGLWFDQGELTRHFANFGGKLAEGKIQRRGTSWVDCPSCAGQALAEGQLDSVSVETCSKCDGIFLDLGEVHDLLGAVARREGAYGPDVAAFDNHALGLYVGMRIRRG